MKERNPVIFFVMVKLCAISNLLSFSRKKKKRFVNHHQLHLLSVATPNRNICFGYASPARGGGGGGGEAILRPTKLR